MIEAVVCDFGGVLTSPLAGSFPGFSAQSGIPLEALGAALAARRACRVVYREPDQAIAEIRAALNGTP